MYYASCKRNEFDFFHMISVNVTILPIDLWNEYFYFIQNGSI